MSADVKPGVKTTEMWLMTAAMIIQAVLPTVALLQGRPWADVAFAVLTGLGAVLGALGYGKQRNAEKVEAKRAGALHDAAVQSAAEALMGAVKTKVRPTQPAKP